MFVLGVLTHLHKASVFWVVSLRFLDLVWRITDEVRSYVSFGVSFSFVWFLAVMSFFLLELCQAGTDWFIFSRTASIL